MKLSKQLLKEAGIQQTLRKENKKTGGGTTSTEAHRVTMIDDKLIKGKDQKTGKEIE